MVAEAVAANGCHLATSRSWCAGDGASGPYFEGSVRFSTLRPGDRPRASSSPEVETRESAGDRLHRLDCGLARACEQPTLRLSGEHVGGSIGYPGLG